MGFLSKLFAPAVGDTLKTAFGVVRQVRNTFAKKLPPDEQAAFDLNMLRIEAELRKGQLEVNKAEAQTGRVFALWRPAVGWVCVIALFVNYITAPILGVWFEVPDIGINELYPLLLGMLGLGAYRTYEKKHDLQGKH